MINRSILNEITIYWNGTEIKCWNKNLQSYLMLAPSNKDKRDSSADKLKLSFYLMVNPHSTFINVYKQFHLETSYVIVHFNWLSWGWLSPGPFFISISYCLRHCHGGSWIARPQPLRCAMHSLSMSICSQASRSALLCLWVAFLRTVEVVCLSTFAESGSVLVFWRHL